MTGISELFALLKVASELFGLLVRKLTRRKWVRVRRLLYDLKPNEVLTARGIFLHFWGEALPDILLPPGETSRWQTLLYRCKKRLMPFKTEQEVEEFMLDKKEEGLVKYEPHLKCWRLRVTNPGSGKYGPKYGSRH